VKGKPLGSLWYSGSNEDTFSIENMDTKFVMAPGDDKVIATPDVEMAYKFAFYDEKDQLIPRDKFKSEIMAYIK